MNDRKKYLCIGLAAILVFQLASGCGTQPDVSDDSEVWTADAAFCDGAYSWMACAAPYLYTLDETAALQMRELDTGRTVQTCSLGPLVSAYGAVQTLCCSEQIIWAAFAQETGETTQAVVVQMNWDGEVLSETVMEKSWFPDETDAYERLPSSMLLYNDGAAVGAGRFVFLLNGQGTMTETVSLNLYIWKLLCDQEGQLYFLAGDAALYAIDLTAENEPDLEPYLQFDGSITGLVSGDGQYDVVESNAVGLFGWDIATAEAEQLLAWSDFPFYGETVGAAFLTDADTLLVQVWDYLTGESNILRFQRTEAAADQQILTLGYVGETPGELAMLVAQSFNLRNTEYAVVLQAYEDADRLKLDMAAGSGPDILFYTATSGVSMEEFIAFDVLTDLYPLLDADKTLNRDAFVPNYLNCIEKDGALYTLSVGFQLSCWFAADGRISEPKSLTAERLLTLAETMKESTVLEDVDGTGFLRSVLEDSMNLFVDFDTGRCSFDNSTFRALLEIGRFYINDSSLDSGAESDSAGSTALLRRSGLGTFSAYAKMAGAGWEMTSLLNREELANIKTVGGGFSISKSCRAPEKAWEVIKLAFSQNAQQTLGSIFFPVLSDAYDALEAAALTAQVITQAQAETLRSLIQSATSVTVTNSIITEIVEEEAAYYFAGDKTAEDVIAIIQDRVGTYLAERS